MADRTGLGHGVFLSTRLGDPGCGIGRLRRRHTATLPVEFAQCTGHTPPKIATVLGICTS
ncbi:hypothetical protein FM112_12440 [Gulosibacter sp. 10]|nr:hypothetical protein FM112_12440 [Gulosibacter sp. 10]